VNAVKIKVKARQYQNKQNRKKIKQCCNVCSKGSGNNFITLNVN